MNRKRVFRIITAFIILLFIAIIGFCSAELYLRIKGKYPTVYISYDEDLIWKMTPGSRKSEFDKSFDLTINSEGYRSAQYDHEKTADVKRILFLGDSYTAGLDYPDDQIFTNLFRQEAKNIEIINISVPGWGTDQHYTFVTQQLLDYNPDVVIWVISPNDIREAYMRKHVVLNNGAPMIQPNTFSYGERWNWMLYNNFHFFNRQEKKENPGFQFIFTIWNHYPVNFGVHDQEHWDLPLFLDSIDIPQVREAELLFTTLSKEIKTHCDQHNITLLATAIPMKAEFSGKIEKLGGVVGKPNQFIQQVCANEHIPFLNLHEKMQQQPDPEGYFISHEFHLNEKGHAFVGNELSAFYHNTTK